ncbi:MAG: hypothetical protein HND42_09475 [Armatimonadetes bacterium]|nr:hypothetical protein [Armatimonadota bacterium]
MRSQRLARCEVRSALAVAASLVCPGALGLVGINLDIDNNTVPPYAGGGVPSASFGAAAGQPGFWNGMTGSNGDHGLLRDLNGQLSTVRMIVEDFSGSTGAWGYLGNTGDYALLLNDGADTWFNGRVRFTGVPNGAYRVFTYAVKPHASEVHPVRVSVSNAAQGQNPQTVTGPMPQNQFIYLQTHAIHDILVSNNEMVVSFQRDANVYGTLLNGLQIVPVPEPTTLTALCALIAGLGLRPGSRRRGVRD